MIPTFSVSFPIKIIATPGGMALASPAYSFAPCRAAPYTDYHGSFCLNFTKCNHPMLSDDRNKGLTFCTDLIAYLLYYADIRSRQNICFTPNNSDLTEQEQALNGWKFGMIGINVPSNSEITSQVADIVSAHSKVIWLSARVTDASVSSPVGHAVAPEIGYLDNNTSRIFCLLKDLSDNTARGSFSAWLFYAYTDD